MIPIHDDNPTQIRPVVTIALIVVNAMVFLWEISLPEPVQERIFYSLGTIPAVLFGEKSLRPEIALVSPELSILTSMFLHGGWMHLIGNMLYLWIFGNNVEDAMGHLRFILFYLLCGIAAALSQAFQDPSSTVPMIGASGAIGGVLGAYLLLHPRANVLVLIPIFFFLHLTRIPAVIVLGFWFVLQFVQSAMTPPELGGGVAYWAHIGGFLTGMVLILVFRRPGVPLLDRGRTSRRPQPWGARR